MTREKKEWINKHAGRAREKQNGQRGEIEREERQIEKSDNIITPSSWLLRAKMKIKKSLPYVSEKEKKKKKKPG